MSKTARRLGRGLQSLVSDYGERDDATVQQVEAVPPEVPIPPTLDPQPGKSQIIASNTAPLNKIVPPKNQPRKDFDPTALQSLASSISQHGVLQPIAVRTQGDTLELVAGERRWRAARMAGLKEIPIVIVEAGERKRFELALVENIQREDLNAIERARAYAQLADEFALSHEEIGTRLGEDRTTVANYIRLLDLPADVRDWVATGQLGMGHARAVLGVPDAAGRTELASTAVRDQMSVRALERLVQTRKRTSKAGTTSPASSHNEYARRSLVRELERRFEDTVKCKVTIREGHRKGSGRIIIEYHSLDDFDRIAGQLGVAMD